MKPILFNTSFILILFLPYISNGQLVTITGYITSEKDDNYLENVNIFESNSIIGTLTDKNGYYHLMLPNGNLKITASLNGYKDYSKKIVIKKDTVFSFKLKPVANTKELGKKIYDNQQTASKEEVKDLK